MARNYDTLAQALGVRVVRMKPGERRIRVSWGRQPWFGRKVERYPEGTVYQFRAWLIYVKVMVARA